MITQNEFDKTLREIEAQNGSLIIAFNDKSDAIITKEQLRVLLERIKWAEDEIEILAK